LDAQAIQRQQAYATPGKLLKVLADQVGCQNRGTSVLAR
jgi:hypothetical protein